MFLEELHPRSWWHGTHRAANRTLPAPLSAAAPSSNSGRGFQRGGPRPAPLCHEGVWGTGGVPHVSGGGLRGRGLCAKGPFPLPQHGNVSLWEQREYPPWLFVPETGTAPAGAANQTGSPYSAQVLLSVTFTSIKLPIRLLSPFSRTSRLPSVREARGKFSSSLSPSTSTRTVLPT